MSEGRALSLVVIGTFLLSAVIDAVLLAMHAGGAALAVAMVLVLGLCSLATNRVMDHYEELKQRHQREATLLH